MAAHHRISTAMPLLLLLTVWASLSTLAAGHGSASSSKQAELPGTADPASERMLQWVQQNGGEVNVAIRAVPGQGRAVYAPRAFSKGDVLARIPVEMLWAQHRSRNLTDGEFAYELAVEMLKPASPWKPYFDALPAPADVVTILKMPESYLSLIQHPPMEWDLMSTRHHIQELWDARHKQQQQQREAAAEAQEGPALSPSNITHAAALMKTRMFSFPPANVLIPVVDMANNQNDCNHTHLTESCDPEEGYLQWQQGTQPMMVDTVGSGAFGPHGGLNSSSGGGGGSSSGGVSGQCLVWRAEDPVAAGESVCNGYGAGLPDRLLLQYGYMQSGPLDDELHLLDRHTQEPGQWHIPFKGNLAATWSEIDRLAGILTWLESGEATAAAVTPDEAADPGGVYLGMLRQWRRQRVAAIQREVLRLYQETELLREGFDYWMANTIQGGVEAVAQARHGPCEKVEAAAAAAAAGRGWAGAIGARASAALHALEGSDL